jgi:formate hydrogenlyase subunit 3/multisubunit Na+/H+ antiporter MnhD subunit
MSLELLLIIAFGGAFLSYFLGKISEELRDGFAIFISFVLIAAVTWFYGNHQQITYFSFLNLPLVLRLSKLSWFFALAISSLGALSVIFSLGYMNPASAPGPCMQGLGARRRGVRVRGRLDFYYFMMLLINAAMLGIVLSGDFISLFIFWEIMSFSTFLLISYNRGPALDAGIKYIVMSIIGSMAMLIAMLSLYATCGTLLISDIAARLSLLSHGYILFILLLFGLTFGIKNAVWPLHTWLPDSYTEAPTPFTVILSGMLTRMGIYGFLLIMYIIAGAAISLNLGPGLFKFNYILAWLGAITIVIPTFIAMLQNDAKRLLAWHGIGQGGYMILGIAFGTSLGLAGGIFHTLNHAIYIVLLFMSVGAVQYRTGGIRDLNSLGGLIKKMPVAFIGALLGVSGLIGIPLTNGFVSKWLIYKTLILEGSPFLAFAALIGTWGTILSVYKFLHNVFLGRLPEKYKNIKMSPFRMQLPMMVLSLAILLFGILPGIPLKVINSIVTSFGFEPLNVTIWGIASETGTLNTINIFAILLVAGIAVWLLSRAGGRAVTVEQNDNYAAGIDVPRDRYQYTVNYYDPLYRMITPFLKDFVDQFYIKLTAGVQKSCSGIRRVYTGDLGYYVTYIVLFLALLILTQLKWSIW